MAPYKIVIEWIDFNSTLEKDLFKISCFSSNEELVKEIETTDTNLLKLVAKELEILNDE